MRVLMVHDRYQIRGGEDECFDAECDLLRAEGIQVDTFEEDNRKVEELGRIRTAVDTVWSRRAVRAIRERLRARPADIVHVHNFFPLISPAIHQAARAEGAAVVQTLHNYRLICPNGIFYRDNRICEDCLGRAVPWPAVLHGCYRGSRAGSAAVTAMLAAHRWLGTWQRQVDLYVALTEFGRRKFIAGGLPAERIAVKPNFVEDLGQGTGRGGYALFAGRLTEEKGIRHLLEAWKILGRRLPLKVMGTGPLEAEVAAIAGVTEGIDYLGRQPLAEVHAAMGEACCFLLTSVWYEGFPRVIAECYARGLPIIASAIGPIRDIVQDGESGLLFRPGDVADLVDKVRMFVDRPDDQPLMRQRVRTLFETSYTAEVNKRQLLAIYRQALDNRQSNQPTTAGAGVPSPWPNTGGSAPT